VHHWFPLSLEFNRKAPLKISETNDATNSKTNAPSICLDQTNSLQRPANSLCRPTNSLQSPTNKIFPECAGVRGFLHERTNDKTRPTITNTFITLAMGHAPDGTLGGSIFMLPSCTTLLGVLSMLPSHTHLTKRHGGSLPLEPKS
jgi:hypothetical protein